MAEVGSGQVAIFPTFKGFRSKVASEVSGAGKESGKTFSSAFSSGAGDPAAALVKKLNAQIASGAKAMSAARLAEQDAAGKVRVAEAALAEARSKSGESSSRALAAEERLASAQRKSAEASARAKSATDQLRQSQSQLADATAAAAASGEQASSRYATGWSSLRQKLSGIVRGSVDSAGESAKGAADSAGRSAGSSFGNGFKALAGPAIALAGAIGFSSFISEAARASDATDKFKATMNFAGLDSSAITEATNAAAEFADQTVYDLPTIQNTIAQLASNGVADYTGLTKAAGNLNAVAGGNADTFKSVAMVMTQTAGAGKLTTENWNQMADAIPGAAGPLMRSLEEAGAYTGNFRDAMAAGEITADEFNAALMKLGNDPVAVEAAKSTKTFEGAIGGLQATINSGLMRALDNMKPAITGVINLMSGGLGKAFDFIGNAWNGLADLFARGDFSGSLAKAFNVEEDSKFVDFLFNIRDTALSVGQGFKTIWAGFKMPADVAESFGANLNPLLAFGQSVKGIFDGITFTAKTVWAGFKMPDDVAASFGANLNPLLAFGQGIRDIFDQVVFVAKTFWAGLTMPPDVAASFGDNLNPILALGQSVQGLLPTIVDLWSAFSPLQIVFQAVQPLLPQIAGLFGTLATMLGTTLTTVLTTLVPLIVQLSGTISEALGGVLAAVLPTIVTLVSMLGTTLAQLLPIIMPIVATIIQLATTLLAQLAPIITQLVSSILPPVVSIFGLVLGAIGPVVQMLAGLLIPIIEALLPVVVTVFGAVADVIGSVMRIIQGIIQVVTGIISGNWSQVWEGIGNIVGGVWDAIVGLIRGALATVGQVVISGLGLVGRFFSDAWRNVTGGVGGFIGELLGFFSGLPGRILSTLGNLGSLLLNAGQALIQGFIDGIKGMVGAIGDAVGGVLDFAKQFFPHSPAKRGPFSGRGYTSFSGQALARDFAGGIDDERRTVAESAARLMSSASLSMNAGNVSAAITGTGLSGGGGNVTYNTTINQVDDPLGTAAAVSRRLRKLAV